MINYLDYGAFIDAEKNSMLGEPMAQASFLCCGHIHKNVIFQYYLFTVMSLIYF